MSPTEFTPAEWEKVAAFLQHRIDVMLPTALSRTATEAQRMHAISVIDEHSEVLRLRDKQPVLKPARGLRQGY